MLGLGSNMMKHPVTGKSIVRDGLVLQHNYNLSSVEPLSSGAASFNGTSDYIAINAKPVDTADGTYAWWSNSTQTANQIIFSHGASNNGSFFLNFATTNKPLLYLQDALFQYWEDAGFADDGKWHHWALVVDIDDMTACKLYCDGVEISQSNRSTSATATSYSNMEIGKFGTTEFDGYMCNFGVWSSHLSQAQVKSIMNKNYDSLSASEKTNLVSWWNLDSAITDGNLSYVYDNHHGGNQDLGSNIVTDGDFPNGSTAWYLNGWTISDNTAHCSGINANLIQTISSSTNKTYSLTFTISNYVSGYVLPAFVGGSDYGTAYTANGTYTTIISSYSDTRFVFYAASFDGSLDDVSVKEINGNTGTLS
tara:strand:- start:456 stop:1550 length:1095 start_codon:yes stop_codon:yes gene_type:complete